MTGIFSSIRLFTRKMDGGSPRTAVSTAVHG
jgi:hypothetical protein